jgi:chorismate mutase
LRTNPMAAFFMFVNPNLPARACEATEGSDLVGRNLFFLYAAEGRMSLADWRHRIDEIDRRLVELLNERSKCALEIGKLKQRENLPLYQPDREKEVLENAEQNNNGPLTHAAIRRLFERIIDEARSAERSAMHPDGKEHNVEPEKN